MNRIISYVPGFFCSTLSQYDASIVAYARVHSFELLQNSCLKVWTEASGGGGRDVPENFRWEVCVGGVHESKLFSH